MTIRLLSGDCRDVLPTLPAESVQCVVTSPPYYGLRDYGTALWDGGDAACDHTRPSTKVGNATTLRLDGREHLGLYAGEKATEPGYPFRDTCGKCGAVRVDRQIGLEATPDEYLATMVAVFREVRRVLRRDGVCFVNMGDSYASGSKGSGGPTPKQATNAGSFFDARKFGMGDAKPKDLLLMPARLALALQADGWWVRSDIIWHKPNPMPESCTDRPTSAHEHVFLLTKSGSPTFWTHRDGLPGHTTQPPPDYRWVHKTTREELDTDPGDPETWRRINLWRGHDYFYDADAVREASLRAGEYPGGDNGRGVGEYGVAPHAPFNGAVPAARNLRNVWTIATHAYSQCHFATFPPELAERCIKAGTSERGACSQCGAPWQRITETAFVKLADRRSTRKALQDGANMSDINSHNVMGYNDVATTGWAPGCQCDADVVPCVVLDCFAGAGTTLLVADRMQRDAIGIELNTAYTEMAMERCRADAPLFTSFPPAEPPENERMADLFTDMAAD